MQNACMHAHWHHASLQQLPKEERVAEQVAICITIPLDCVSQMVHRHDQGRSSNQRLKARMLDQKPVSCEGFGPW